MRLPERIFGVTRVSAFVLLVGVVHPQLRGHSVQLADLSGARLAGDGGVSHAVFAPVDAEKGMKHVADPARGIGHVSLPDVVVARGLAHQLHDLSGPSGHRARVGDLELWRG